MSDRKERNVHKPIIGPIENVIPMISTSLPLEIEVEKISNVQHKAIEWLWHGVLAYGKMTLIAGNPGVGKSQLLLYMASVISHGYAFHYQRELVTAANVLLISGEDNADDTIKPRLMALNANLERIDYVKGIKKLDKKGRQFYDPICLSENLEELEQIIVKNQYRLIIVDPISLYLGKVDENKNKEIRQALSHLQAVAERNRFCLVLNSHFSKQTNGNGRDAISRIMGSIGFAAAARIVYGVMKDPEKPDRRLFLPIKNNIGQDTEGLAYTIQTMNVAEGIQTSRINWLDEHIKETANEILSSAPERPSPRTDEAVQFLQNLLKNGSMALRDIRTKADEKGIKAPRLYAAKNELKIYETFSVDRKNGKIWMLPC